MSLVGNYVKIGMYIGCKAGILKKKGRVREKKGEIEYIRLQKGAT